MGTQQFCLKWNNHHSNMLAVFEQLLSSEALVDVTLACEGLSLKAHKMVLSACSPFFQSLFLENPCKHPIVILKDMRYTDLKAIIDFMYRGEVNVSQDQLSALLKTAETLKVKGLAEVTGDNRQGNGSGIVQQEIVQHNSTPQSTVPATGASTQHRAESPPLSRRKRGRPRRRSLSDSNRSDSEDQIPSKIKEPDSPEIIEDVNNEISTDGVDVRQRLVVNQQSQVSSQPPNVPHLPPIASHKPHPALPSIHTQDARNVNMEENPSGDEGDFDVDASKLMEQTMTTENVPVFADGQASGSSILPVSTQVSLTSSTSGIVDTRPLQIAQVPASDSQALDPVTDQNAVVIAAQDTTQDIKPMVSFEEPPISPVAGPSHGQDNSSSSMMMYMDTSGVPAIAGPSNYQPEKQTSSQQQQSTQGRAISQMFHSRSILYTCDICKYASKTKTQLNAHCQRVHSGERPFKCDLCNESFAWKLALQQHLLSHKGHRPFKCKLCSNSYKSMSALNYHYKNHTGEKPFRCENCPKSFRKRYNLKRHSMVHNTSDKPFKCEKCLKAFTCQTLLTSHSIVHTEEKAFKCDKCSKSFKRKNQLTVHDRNHTGETPYKCEKCPMAFRFTSQLFSHRRIAHTAQKYYKCEKCSRAFAQKKELNYHYRVHAGQKPF